MKYKAAVAILASESLALGSVSRQHARKSFVPQYTPLFFCSFHDLFIKAKKRLIFFFFLIFPAISSRFSIF